ncbi:MAG: phosphoribosylformylglycinamidine synthase subunit PurS [Armatimonadetes bacterium]|nr:phosphoribosylformylglycinamidine synthase subunit PurS [Armatimonadota bacterium]
MIEVELLVRLKIPDVTALTAANSLRRRMGYADSLERLRRADYYRLGLNAGTSEEALALARELAENTNLFVNPNKHAYQVRLPDAAAPASAGPVHEVEVLITDPNDGSAQGALAALRGRLGFGNQVASLTKGVLWLMDLRAADHGAAKQLAEQIAVTRRIDEGLLMNPHFQECTVR